MTVETDLCTGVSEIEETNELNLTSLEDQDKDDEIVCDTDEKSDTGESSYVFIKKESDSTPKQDATMKGLIGDIRGNEDLGKDRFNPEEDHLDEDDKTEDIYKGEAGEVIENQEPEVMVLENFESKKAEDKQLEIESADCSSELAEGEVTKDGDSSYVFIDVLSNEPTERAHIIEGIKFSDFPQSVIVGSVICGMHQITTSGSPESSHCSSGNAKSETGKDNSSSDMLAEAAGMNGLSETDTNESANHLDDVYLESEGGSSPSLRNTENTFSFSSYNSDEKMEKKPIFRYLIKVPRYFDDTIRQQIDFSQLQVDEATRLRDAVRAKVATKKASCNEFRDIYEASKSETRAAYGALYLKRQDIDFVQSILSRINNAISIEETDCKMHNMQHMMEHETISLKEEKQLLREMKQLKLYRQQLCSSIEKQAVGKPTFDQKEELEKRLKLLKQDLDSARKEILRTEGITESARKIYFDENEELRDIQSQLESANVLRQEAYAHVLKLKKQLYDKNKYFRMYKDDARKAEDYGFSGDREALHSHCVNQVEKIMELWNKNDDFRNNYVRCNTVSTLRRLGTLDGSSLGPNDDPPLLQKFGDGKLTVSPAASTESEMNAISPVPQFEQGKPVLPLDPENAEVKSAVKQKQKNEKAQFDEVMSSVLSYSLATVSDEMEVEKKLAAENKQTQENEELLRKEEGLRKEAAAAKIRKQSLLEERAKAKEAEERKRRKAEKAQAIAELKAQREAEYKEKERAKRERRKARKNASKAISEQGSSGPHSESSTLPEPAVTHELEIEVKPKTTETRTTTGEKRSSSLSAKQKKAVPPPPCLLNKNRKRMQPWLWDLLMALVAGLAALIFLATLSK